MKMMDATVERAFQKLEANLEELTKIYRSLLDIVRKEKELLLKADRDALDESNKLKEDLLFKLRAQDSLRSRYAMDLANLVGADAENPRLLELAQKLAGTPAAYRTIRSIIPHLEHDRILALDIEAMVALMRSGELLRSVEEAIAGTLC